MDYTITITETEKKALETIAINIDDWITNATQNRARLAIQEILDLNMAYCNENGITIATGEDAQVTQAYTLGVVSKATSDDSSPE
jgi:Flp pilus assembly protein TadG|tara:strand:- start:191 stop:445 length:255 start_codon:yes stop_codon:yes gene_type:complete